MKNILWIGILLSAIVTHAGIVMTWVPPYQPALSKSWANLNADFGGVGMKDGLTHLALQFWLPGDSGKVVKDQKYEIEDISDSVIANFVEWGDSNDVKTLLCVYNNDGKWNWNLAKSGFKTHKDSFIVNLIGEMTRHNLDGIELDLEGQGVTSKSDRAAFMIFVKELSVKLREMGKDITIATYASEWHTPGANMWTELAPLVDAITTMGYHEIGRNAGGYLSYEVQKKWIKVEQEKLLMGMPGWKGAWLGNKVTEQLDWVIEDGQVGVAIWDAAMGNGNWKTEAAWLRIQAIKDDLAPMSSVPLSSSVPAISSSSAQIDAVNEYFEIGLNIAGRQSSLSSGKWQLLTLNGEISASGDYVDLSSVLKTQEPGVYFIKVMTNKGSKVARLLLK
jgi:hypothetical protein